MTATLDDEVADLRRANAELHRKLDERTRERDETEAQKAAMAEVLEVINSSPGDLTPVFDGMLEKAMRLCGAAFGFMTVIDGERSRTVAARGVPAAYATFRKRNPTPATAPIASRVRKGEPFIHTVDLKAERFYEEGDPQRRAIVDLAGARTLLAAPLMRDQAVLGAIQVYRTEVRPFSESRSHCCRTSPRRRSSRWRTRDCLPRLVRHWSSRPRLPRYCRLSMPRPATSGPFSTRSWRRRTTAAPPPSVPWGSSRAIFGEPWCSVVMGNRWRGYCGRVAAVPITPFFNRCSTATALSTYPIWQNSITR